MWQLSVIYKKLLYSDSDFFHVKKREQHHFNDTILTLDWIPEMCQKAGFYILQTFSGEATPHHKKCFGPIHIQGFHSWPNASVVI